MLYPAISRRSIDPIPAGLQRQTTLINFPVRLSRLAAPSKVFSTNGRHSALFEAGTLAITITVLYKEAQEEGDIGA